MNTSARPRLAAESRTITGKKVAGLRRQGILPAVVYGHGHASEAIQIDAHEFDVLRRRTGRNAVLDLVVGSGQGQTVLLQHVQEHPLHRRPVHADFFIVSMTEEMAVDVPLAFVGSSEAVERHGGTLLHLRDSIHVRALPGDLPSFIEVDISALADFDTTLHVSDLAIPERVTVMTDAGEAIARVQTPRVEVEPVAAEPAGEAAVEPGSVAEPTAEG